MWRDRGMHWGKKIWRHRKVHSTRQGTSEIIRSWERGMGQILTHTLRRNQYSWHLDLRLLAYRTGGQQFSVFYSPSLWYFVMLSLVNKYSWKALWKRNAFFEKWEWVEESMVVAKCWQIPKSWNKKRWIFIQKGCSFWGPWDLLECFPPLFLSSVLLYLLSPSFSWCHTCCIQ